MWNIGIPKLETAFNLSVGLCRGGEIRAVTALAGACDAMMPPGAHCQVTICLHLPPLHIPVKDIKMHRAGLSDGPMPVYNVYILWCEDRQVATWGRARLIVLFLSSSNSGSLGIEFKWVTWRGLAPDAACCDFAKLTASSTQPCLGLSLLPSALQTRLDTNSGSNGSIFHSSALVTSPNLTRARPPPLLTPHCAWVMTNTPQLSV